MTALAEIDAEKKVQATDGVVKPRILLVEDAESIQLAIRDFLFPYYNVVNVSAAESGLEALKESKFDLLVTDINLPGMNGLELIQVARKIQPDLKVIVITSYDINTYIQHIKDEEIDQVISKHSSLSLFDIYVTIQKTISGDIFGVQKYFPDIKVHFPNEITELPKIKNGEVYSVLIKSFHDRIYWTDKISDILKSKMNTSESLVKLVLDEITTNAMFRAPRNDDGTFKYQRKIHDTDTLVPIDNVKLEEEDYFTVQFGYFNDWVILTCKDPSGTLSKKEILYRLKRHIVLNPETGVPDGLTDNHGRGIFLLREHLNHLIFNISPGKKTEVICLYNTRQHIPYKNISIYEL